MNRIFEVKIDHVSVRIWEPVVQCGSSRPGAHTELSRFKNYIHLLIEHFVQDEFLGPLSEQGKSSRRSKEPALSVSLRPDLQVFTVPVATSGDVQPPISHNLYQIQSRDRMELVLFSGYRFVAGIFHTKPYAMIEPQSSRIANACKEFVPDQDAVFLPEKFNSGGWCR